MICWEEANDLPFILRLNFVFSEPAQPFPSKFEMVSPPPRLTGAGARSAEGTNTGHENAEGMASVGVRVEPTVRPGRVVEVLTSLHGLP